MITLDGIGTVEHLCRLNNHIHVLIFAKRARTWAKMHTSQVNKAHSVFGNFGNVFKLQIQLLNSGVLMLTEDETIA